jgi:tetrahydromethanopterin S-methyltransferase subunit G
LALHFCYDGRGGGKMSETMQCPYCEEENQVGVIKCVHCGMKVDPMDYVIIGIIIGFVISIILLLEASNILIEKGFHPPLTVLCGLPSLFVSFFTQIIGRKISRNITKSNIGDFFGTIIGFLLPNIALVVWSFIP